MKLLSESNDTLQMTDSGQGHERGFATDIDPPVKHDKKKPAKKSAGLYNNPSKKNHTSSATSIFISGFSTLATSYNW